ncbi:MAG: LCP family protein [Actinomycetota bacterium]|nr:LCP family protein [Actinomycetota bacterium]
MANLVALGALWAIRTGQDVLATAETDAQVAVVLDESSGDDLTFLIVGSDSREGLDDLTNFGPVGGARGDVIMLVKVDSTDSSVQILSIPRDLWVEIPGYGSNRINASYALGGSSLMVETIQQSLGIEVNHYIEVDFLGFAALVDELGGIEVAFPFAARDLKSGLDVDAGSQTLDGDMALAYARSRTYQEYRNGSWVSVEANDIGRTQRQQEVVRAILSKLKRPGSIAEAGAVAAAMAEHMVIDSGLATSSVGSLAWDYKGVLTSYIAGITFPTKGATIDGKSVLVALEPEASEVLATFRAGDKLGQDVIRVQVLNGNGIGGSAGRMAAELEAAGFEVAAIGDASSDEYEVTSVLVPTESGVGEQIVDALGFGVVETGSVDNGYDAIVFVGADSP